MLARPVGQRGMKVCISSLPGAISVRHRAEVVPIIVKLEGLLEMEGLARLSLRRKENRQKVAALNGQSWLNNQLRGSTG